MSPQVAIIGAGPAGLTLGRILSLSNVSNTIFERDQDPKARFQGGSLDLHPTQGEAALKKADIYEAFLKHARYDGEAQLIVDPKGNVIRKIDQHTAETSNGKPEIDRASLRQILLDATDENAIQWGSRVKQVIEKEDGKKAIILEDSSEHTGFDLIVGAEGAYSRTRGLVTDQQPQYSGVTAFTASVTNVTTRFPELAALVNRGSFLAGGLNRWFGAQWTSDDSLFMVIEHSTPAGYSQRCGYDVKDPKAVKEALVEVFKDFYHIVHDFIRAADDESLVYRELTMLPLDFEWAHKRGITLIGDAAHLMTHFAGKGVNMALTDAMDLADAIISAKDADEEELDRAIQTYERKMWTRSHVYAKLTADNMYDMVLADDAAQLTAFKRYAERMASEPGGEQGFLDGGEI